MTTNSDTILAFYFDIEILQCHTHINNITFTLFHDKIFNQYHITTFNPKCPSLPLYAIMTNTNLDIITSFYNSINH